MSDFEGTQDGSSANALGEVAPGLTARCLVVEDDETTSQLITSVLKQEGFEVQAVASGEDAVEWTRRDEPDVIIMDFELPGVNGQQACRLIREFSDVFIVMVTGRGAELDRVLTLSLGADDYLVKPFSPSELVARVRAMLRRSRNIAREGGEAATPSSPDNELQINQQARVATIKERAIPLTTLEFDLLTVLLESSPDPVARKELMRKGWGDDWVGDDHLVDVHISNIRRKLHSAEATATRILNVRGFGFRLVSGPCD